jgi:hypothetical protein
MLENKVIGWWSGGVTSAVACKLAQDLFGAGNVRFIFIDTDNEDEDTYRFLKDCEKWYGAPIEIITGLSDKFKSIEDVWTHYKTLNSATGAICSSTLKRDVRLTWEKENAYSYQVFGFDLDEPKRAKSMSLNHKQAKAIYPLLLFGYLKKDCLDILGKAGIEIPRAYALGFVNNNCFKTMCIQGGIGYWQKVKELFPEKFDKMADLEHRLTDLKGQPVTMLKDRSNGGNALLFLKPHKNYPDIKSIDQMKGRPPKPLFECNGFCGTNDFGTRNETENEINFETGESL